MNFGSHTVGTASRAKTVSVNNVVSVEFIPTAAGTRTASLQFNDDGGAGPQTVTLVGTGS